MIREGYIEKIVYKSDETGYCVMSVEGEEGEEIFVGRHANPFLSATFFNVSISNWF